MIRLGLLLFVVVGCSKASDPPKSGASNEPAPPADAAPAAKPAAAEWYRVVVGEKQGTAIPFFLNVPATGDEAFVATGPDRVRAKLVSRAPKLVIEFDILRTRMEATVANGKLDGTWSSTSGSWGKASLSFTGEAIESPDKAQRFPSAPGGPDPVGVWKIKFPDQLGKLTVLRGERELTATIAFQTGNLAFLSGTQEGKTLRMSAFDGSSPYLLVVDLDGKKLAGTWTAGQALAWKEQITGELTGEFALELQTKVASPKLKVAQLAEAPYKGNPVIVELGGSWCPACGHASAKLKELRDKYAGDKLQVLMLAYEFTDDTEYNKTQANAFKKKYDIPWDVVPIDGDLEKYNEILPAALKGIDASGFPITIFVARDGTIAGFHSGFPPKSWGAVHEHAIAEYDRLSAAIAKK
jgi:thiol-disulfide isomerase/thioredoxin